MTTHFLIAFILGNLFFSHGTAEYQFVKGSFTWSEGQKHCQQYGMEMSRFDTPEEFTAARNIVVNKGNTWVGLYRSNSCANGWYYPDNGECLEGSVNNMAWAPGEPNNAYGGSENCVGTYDKGNYYLNDFICTDRHNVLCQTKEADICENPTDHFVVLYKQDNSASSISVRFSAKKKIGTTIKDTDSSGGSEIQKVTEQEKNGLFKAFSEKVGYSQTTKFDWRETTTESYSTAVTTTVRYKCPALTVCILSQVYGNCEDYEIGVESLKLETIRENGMRNVQYL